MKPSARLPADPAQPPGVEAFRLRNRGKLGIRTKLFSFALILIALSLVVADVYLSATLDRELTERISSDLRVRLRLAHHSLTSRASSLATPAARDDLIDELGRLSRARATWIGQDGALLGDSELTALQLGQQENHADRPEVIAALTRGQGESIRHSRTLGTRMLYAALPLGPSSSPGGVIRLALPLQEIDQALAALHRTLLMASLVALLLAALFTGLASHLASRSLRALTAAARAMAGGDLSIRSPAAGQDEFGELGRALEQLAHNLSHSLAELREERDRQAGILAGMQEGVLLLDREGRVTLTNPALRELFLLPAEVLGRPLLEVVRHAELKALLDRATQAAAPLSGELELTGLQPRRLLVHASPLGPTATLVVFVDVTTLRRLETLRRDFVANASHELRTPVASASAALETLRSFPPDAAAGTEFLGIIERNLARLRRLLDDLLDLSRIEAREFRLLPEPLVLPEQATAALASFRERAATRSFTVTTAWPDDLPAVHADRRGLEQVLNNLLDNALKYCPPGSQVVLRAAPEGGFLRIDVQDDGPGIEAHHLPRLFERFYRVDPGRSRELGGTGLGLSIVKHLVEAMGGTVRVTSTVGRGSTFSFTLPQGG